MGRKMTKHLNELRARALAGDRLAGEAFARAVYVPQHLRADGFRRQWNGPRVQSSHFTAKTHKTVPCLATPTVNIADRVARIQMLEARHAPAA